MQKIKVVTNAGTWTTVPDFNKGLWCLWLGNEDQHKIYFIVSSSTITILNQSWYNMSMQLESAGFQIKYGSSTTVNLGRIN